MTASVHRLAPVSRAPAALPVLSAPPSELEGTRKAPLRTLERQVRPCVTSNIAPRADFQAQFGPPGPPRRTPGRLSWSLTVRRRTLEPGLRLSDAPDEQGERAGAATEGDQDKWVGHWELIWVILGQKVSALPGSHLTLSPPIDPQGIPSRLLQVALKRCWMHRPGTIWPLGRLPEVQDEVTGPTSRRVRRSIGGQSAVNWRSKLTAGGQSAVKKARRRSNGGQN